MRAEIPDQEDELLTSVITVIKEDGTPCSDAEILIAGLTGITDESGQCIINNIPILDEYIVSLVVGDSYATTQNCSPDTIASIVFTVPVTQTEYGENDEGMEEDNELFGPDITPTNGGVFSQGDEF